MCILFICLNIHILYGQSKTDFHYVKLDSVEFIHKPIFEEIQKNVIPFLISKKYNNEKYMVSLSFSEYSKRHKELTYLDISIFNNYDYYEFPGFKRNPLGYCKINGFIFIITGEKSYLYAKKITHINRLIKCYSKPYSGFDGIVTWMYFIKGEQIKLFKHIENW